MSESPFTTAFVVPDRLIIRTNNPLSNKRENQQTASPYHSAEKPKINPAPSQTRFRGPAGTLNGAQNTFPREPSVIGTLQRKPFFRFGPTLPGLDPTGTYPLILYLILTSVWNRLSRRRQTYEFDHGETVYGRLYFDAIDHRIKPPPFILSGPGYRMEWKTPPVVLTEDVVRAGIKNTSMGMIRGFRKS